MSEGMASINLTIPDSEVVKSGVDAVTYVFGTAKRKAMEKSSEVSMIEYQFDETSKSHRVIVYLKKNGQPRA